MARNLTNQEVDLLVSELEYNASLLEDGHWNIGKAQELKQGIIELAAECKRRVDPQKLAKDILQQGVSR